MEDKPLRVIEYATPDSKTLNPDEPIALVLGIITACFWLGSMLALIAGNNALWKLYALIFNMFGLILGGVGWGLSRHSRPNVSYRLCAWANTLNWLFFIGTIVFLITR